MPTQQAKEQYEVWNAAIAEVLFPLREDPEPAYLDLEAAEAAALAEMVGIPVPQVEAELCRAVAGTVDFTGPRRDTFGYHRYRVERYAASPEPERQEAPPSLALLAVFSLAAEQMAGDGEFCAANYYGRLGKILGIDDRDRVRDGYVTVADACWEGLNEWLESLDGTRGDPTAFRLQHRYVGYALSQALVRKVDRERLRTFFVSRNLAPGALVSGEGLTDLLDEWFTSPDCRATESLKRLWGQKTTRPRIAAITATELAHWDGQVADPKVLMDGGGIGERIVLRADLQTFPGRRLAVSALVYASQPQVPRDGVITTQERRETVPLVPDGFGALRLGDTGQMGSENLISGLLEVEDRLTGVVVRRRPRRLVVLRKDELSGAFKEVDQAMLGDDHLLLCHGELLPRLHHFLDGVARPGWEVVPDGVKGLPEGWAIVRGVQVMSFPSESMLPASKMDDLARLVPPTSTQLVLAGGLMLPGASRNRWHVEEPPEVRVVSDAQGGFQIQLEDLELEGDDRLLEQWSDGGAGVLTVPMAAQELEPGRYRIVVLDGEENVMTSRAMILASGDCVDQAQWSRVVPVGHRVDDPLCAVLADDGPDLDGDLVYGAQAIGTGAGLAACAIPPQPWWSGAHRPTRPVQPFKAPEPGRKSCIYTGAHQVQVDSVPVDTRNRPLSKWTVGRCTACGLERRYPTRPSNSREKQRQVERRINDVAALPPVLPASDQPWDLVWDALGCVGGGTWTTLQRLAFRIEPSALAVDLFARTVQNLGHVDLQVDPMTMRPRRWEIGPSSLTRCEDGWYLAGYWPAALTNQVLEAAESVGAVTEQVLQHGAPSRWLIRDVQEEMLHSAVDALGRDVEWSGGWRDLAPLLPPLSAVMGGLRRVRLPLAEGCRIRRWDVGRTTWVDARSMDAPGAYRVSRFTTEDYVRTEQDVRDGTVAISDVYLSKHVAALLEGATPYLAHHPVRQTLTVPLGADLPGLYARAVVMASGRAPVRDEARRLLHYQQVPAHLAQHIAHLFSR